MASRLDKRWPNSIVPYTLDSRFSIQERATIAAVSLILSSRKFIAHIHWYRLANIICTGMAVKLFKQQGPRVSCKVGWSDIAHFLPFLKLAYFRCSIQKKFKLGRACAWRTLVEFFFITGTFKNKFFILFSNTLQKPLPRRKLVCFCFFASGGRVSLLPGDFYIIIDWSSSPGFKPGASSSEICCATEANSVWWILNVVLMQICICLLFLFLSHFPEIRN